MAALFVVWASVAAALNHGRLAVFWLTLAAVFACQGAVFWVALLIVRWRRRRAWDRETGQALAVAAQFPQPRRGSD